MEPDVKPLHIAALEDEKVPLLVEVPRRLRTQLRILALERNQTLQKLVIDAFDIALRVLGNAK
jgi:hypothetical protein